MTIRTSLFLALPFVLITGCASVSAPDAKGIARLPVVSYGQPAPTQGDFVLHYPAEVDLPVIARVGGTLLSKTDEAQLKVRLKRDVYVYRDLASFDRQQWRAGQSLIGGRLSITLPGERVGEQGPVRDAVSPGDMAAEFNIK